MFSCILFVVLIVLLAFAALAEEERNVHGNLRATQVDTEVEESQERRKLSSTKDIFTNEIIRTYNGQVPRVSCEAGFYRPPGGSALVMITGQRLDGCIPCPRGTYGSQSGLTDRSCSGSCAPGKYSDSPGRTSPADCEPCPLGRYGAAPGLSSCPGVCKAGTYTRSLGAKDESECVPCTPDKQTITSPSWPCRIPLLPRYNRRTKELNS